MTPRESGRPSRKSRDAERRRHEKRKSSHRKNHSSSEDADSSGRSHALSANALAQLNRENARRSTQARRESDLRAQERRERRAKRAKRDRDDDREVRRPADARDERHRKRRKQRVVSGAILEEGRGVSGIRGGTGGSYDSLEKEDFPPWPDPSKKKRKRLCEGVTHRARKECFS